MKNPELDLALDFVEKTNRNIFLTGKAGTGKTTFLQFIKSHSMKRLVVVAPTGVAAINAKGVTIHSFFQMPFGPILPENDPRKVRNQFQRKFNKSKIDIIRSLDLLIIDEISMVRADLLDGIDQVLRKYKSRTKVFGGVQVLMIGDLQQLSPVVKPQEWDLLKDHYQNAFFFSSKAFRESNSIGIELKHIYRQDDEKFIAILNEIRNNRLSPASAEVLNSRYNPEFEVPKDGGYITLTTHNNRANAINELELKKLKGKTFTFKAEIEGKFSEYAYPTHENLELKKGAQVMFIKNDSSMDKLYYNGKIGKITKIGKKSITVYCPGDDDEINVSEETWENTTYKIDAKTKEITNEVVGSFIQIPLRLAWAITIHKSQGLTFEKAIIDAEASFAHGQTYVALSRCKSLEGVVLKTPIRSSSIISDGQVNAFTQNIENNQPDDKDLLLSQKEYELNMIADLFDYYECAYPLQRLIEIYYKNKASIKGNILDVATRLKEEKITELMKVSHSFHRQVIGLSSNATAIDQDNALQERLGKAINYFVKFTKEELQASLNSISFSTDNKQVKKDINGQLDRLEELLADKLFCLAGLTDKFSVGKYLELRAKAVLEKKKKKTSPVETSREEITETEHPVLFDQLRSLRTRLAKEEGVEPFQIFTQKSLYEMCVFFPDTANRLYSINGMGKVRVVKYGGAIIEIILKYTDENNLNSKGKEIIASKSKNSPTKEVTFDLFKAGKTIEEIAGQRELVRSTIVGHLAFYVEQGKLKITDIISKEKYEELKTIIQKSEFETLSDLKHQIDEKFSYEDLKLVVGDMKK